MPGNGEYRLSLCRSGRICLSSRCSTSIGEKPFAANSFVASSAISDRIIMRHPIRKYRSIGTLEVVVEISRNIFSVFLINISILIPFSGAKSAEKGVTWGKSGVSLSQYTTDSIECADTSQYVTVHIKPDTLRELSGLSSVQLYSIASGSGNGHGDLLGALSGQGSFQSEKDIARRSNTFNDRYQSAGSHDIREELQDVLEKCLTERGYIKIRLTESQRKILSGLKRHSSKRTAYLHEIGSDHKLIEYQKIQN